MSEMRAAMLRLFARVDPWGLLAAGAPADEYAPEVDRLMDLDRAVTADDVRGVFFECAAPADLSVSEDDALELADGIAAIRARTAS